MVPQDDIAYHLMAKKEIVQEQLFVYFPEKNATRNYWGKKNHMFRRSMLFD